MSTTFFFVNKIATSSTLTSSGANETTAIQKFVQKGRKRPRINKLVIRRPPSNGPVGASGTTSIHTHESDNQSQCESAARAAKTSSKQAHQGITSKLTKISKPEDSLQLCHPVSAKDDPFGTMCMTIDEDVRTLVDYYTTIYHPTLWPNETLALRRGAYVFESDVNQVIVSALQDDLAMYCLLAASMCRMKYVDRLPIVVKPWRENEYMTRAIRLVQDRIERASTEPNSNLLHLASAIIFLSAGEAYRDNYEASRFHLDAIVDLLAVHNMTVMDVPQKNLQGMLLMSDLFLGCVNLERCFFSSHVYDPGPAEILNLSEAELYPLPEELEDISVSSFTDFMQSDEVMASIEKISEAYIIKMCLNTSQMTPERALSTTHWITKRCMAIRADLLSSFLPVRLRLGKTATLPHECSISLDSAVRLCLIQFTLLAMNITGRVKTVKIMSNHLKEILERLLEHKGAQSNDYSRSAMFFWLLTTGFSCAQANSETEDWFEQKWQECADVHLDIDTVYPGGREQNLLHHIERMLRKLFYRAPVQRPRLQLLLERWRATRLVNRQ